MGKGFPSSSAIQARHRPALPVPRWLLDGSRCARGCLVTLAGAGRGAWCAFPAAAGTALGLRTVATVGSPGTASECHAIQRFIWLL